MKTAFMLVNLILITVSLTLTACTSYEVKEREFDPALCEESISYQAGFNDGREGRNMNSAYAFRCREDLRPGALKGYQQGYDKGHVEHEALAAERRKQMAEMEKTRLERERLENERARREGTGVDGTGGNTGNGGIIINFPGGNGNANGNQNRMLWTCELEAFNKTFSGRSEYKTIAKENAQKACVAQYNKMFCEEFKCTQE